MEAKKKAAKRKGHHKKIRGAQQPNVPREETVQISKQLAAALCGVLASTLGLNAKDSAFINGMLTGEYRCLEQAEIDKLVIAVHKRCGGEVGSAVGYLFNDPKLVGYGRHSSGGHTFRQIARMTFV